jgi:hypothetical protein
MSSRVMSSLANVTGCRNIGEATSVPMRIREVASAAATRVGIAANQE